MTEFLTINNGTVYENAPREIFDKAIEGAKALPAFFRIASVVGWVGIEARIIENKHQVSFPLEGLALCNFGIKVINGDGEAKIPKRDLHLGTECLKSLQEIYCNREYYSSEEDRMRTIQWWKVFLDIWKERFEECLKNENRMIAYNI